MSPDGMLSSSVFAGIMIPAVPAWLPFPAGSVGTLSPSDLNLLALWALLGRCPRLIMLVSCRQWILIVDSPGGLVPAVWTEFPDMSDPVVTQLPAEVPVGDNRDVVDMDHTDSRAVVAMVGLDTVRIIRIARILVVLRMRNMWISITLMLWKDLN